MLALLTMIDPVPKMLRNEVMPSRHVGNHRTRCERLGNDAPLLLVAPPTSADDARDLRPAPNNVRVVTDVDHNVHTIRDPSRIATVHNPVRSTMWEQSTAYDVVSYTCHLLLKINYGERCRLANARESGMRDPVFETGPRSQGGLRSPACRCAERN
jgi:hypothetical protein